MPYGDRDDDDLARLLAHDVAYLEDAGAEAVVMGCNTSCAVAARRGWPSARIPIFDLIAAAATTVASSGAQSVGVIATAATARSGAYGNALRALNPALSVQEVAAPKLVPLVESGLLTGPIARAAVAEALAAFALPIETLVLACTHYPLLDAEFVAVLDAGVTLVDPALAQADAAVRFVRERGTKGGTGRTHFATTGATDAYRSAIEAILGGLGAGDSVGSATIAQDERKRVRSI